MSVIRVYQQLEPEYLRLQKFCDDLNALDPKPNFHIETVFFDFGQNWRWTTIVAKSRTLNAQYQCLSPSQMAQIMNPRLSGNDWDDLLREVLYHAD